MYRFCLCSVYILALVNFSCFCCLLTFSKLSFSKKDQEHYQSVKRSNALSVLADLDPRCLQNLSAYDKIAGSKEKALCF